MNRLAVSRLVAIVRRFGLMLNTRFPRFRRGLVSDGLPNITVGCLALLLAMMLTHCLTTTVSAQDRPSNTKQPSKEQDDARAAEAYRQQVAPLLSRFCYECHGSKKQRAGVKLHQVPADVSLETDRKTWEKALEMLEFGAMPPEGKPQPTEAERKLLVDWLQGRLFHINCDLVDDPGRVTIRRLNRAEYNNTVRDLLGVNFRPADDFPSDDVGYGFDNIGDVLSLPPLLLEKYLAAAEQIADVAVAGDPSGVPRQRRSGGRLESDNGGRRFGRSLFGLSSTGSGYANFDFPKTGEYLLRARAGAQQAGPEIARMELRLEGKKVGEFEVEASREDMENYELRLNVEAGQRRFDAAFINDYYQPKARDPKDRDRNLYLGGLEVVGPLPPPAAIEGKPSLVVIRPEGSSAQASREAALHTLKPLVQRAFRRRTSDQEVDRFVGLAMLARQRGDSYERGLKAAITAVLVSPHFLFRVERDSSPDDPRAQHELADYELATRLSYFLWSSMPDDELFSLATRGMLHKPEVLREQAERMLRDGKSRALADNFAAQWLNLGILDEATPDPKQFKEFDPTLRRDMREETLRFFDAVMREDRSVLDFLDGRFTFVNERLAKLYGMPEIRGGEFRKVSLEGTPRAGVLTQGSILTLTSNPTRTSPVKRGKWIMENILGTPPPDPPPDVPELDAAQKAAPTATLRQQLELHRRDAVCASCHKQMDPLGFGFENFDAIGRWRTTDGGEQIDASGTLPGGESFRGPLELVTILKQRQKEFSRSLASKLLTYALGRGLERYDECAIDEIDKQLAADDYRFSTLVTAIVTSDPFRARRGDGGQP